MNLMENHFSMLLFDLSVIHGSIDKTDLLPQNEVLGLAMVDSQRDIGESNLDVHPDSNLSRRQIRVDFIFKRFNNLVMFYVLLQHIEGPVMSVNVVDDDVIGLLDFIKEDLLHDPPKARNVLGARSDFDQGRGGNNIRNVFPRFNFTFIINSFVRGFVQNYQRVRVKNTFFEAAVVLGLSLDQEPESKLNE